MVRLWLTGLPVREAAKRTGTSVSTVYRWIRRWREKVDMRYHYGRRLSTLWRGRMEVIPKKLKPSSRRENTAVDTSEQSYLSSGSRIVVNDTFTKSQSTLESVASDTITQAQPTLRTETTIDSTKRGSQPLTTPFTVYHPLQTYSQSPTTCYNLTNYDKDQNFDDVFDYLKLLMWQMYLKKFMSHFPYNHCTDRL